ncbi:hypothetical protein A4X06_0g8762 [Tilletia controversa]|uniref:Extracellular membrane protein CFEM domain-containing protein n=1 Tax=Tilletia controversa TaxID=13291 RepID=A0A8X7SSS5_9BASI|nr:hypothetical protein CF328_g8264 [Tilletia controversa]KAE8183770.1 hypothetical protein CF335_g8222 [Tilletia laevis]KAE8196480.1 hypothetical protein CF336_g2600 [Tilletia laevis]KAE8238431.1 hypothetical protein A4X06_0g8762 [Tilletia controversa]
MKSISSFMLIGMLFAISGVNANSPVQDICIKLSQHCEPANSYMDAIKSCLCQVWTAKGNGDCYKGCTDDHPHNKKGKEWEDCRYRCDKFREEANGGCPSVPKSCQSG